MSQVVDVQHYPPGVGIDPTGTWDIGDIVLTHGDAWMSKLIRFGQKHSLFGVDASYARWNHACIATTADGDMAEALLSGVVPTHIENYRGRDYYVIHLNLTDEDKAQIVYYVNAVLNARYRYGVTTIASIVLTLLTGTNLVFGTSGTAICSGFVCEALCRAGFVWPKPPSHMMPGDIAQMFRIRP